MLSTTSSKVVNISQAKVTDKKQITVSNNSNFINYSKEVTTHIPFNVVSDFKYKDKTYQIAYDDLKLNITRITDGVNIQTFEYDKFNRLIKETKTDTSTNITISTEYAYDQLGNMTSRVKKSGSTVIETNTFGYSNNQLSSQTKNNVLKTISTNTRGNIVEFTNSSGKSLSCEYNKLNQLIKVTIQSQNSSRALLPPLAPLVTEYIEFKYDESGRRKEKYHYKNDTYYLDTERITYRYINGLLVEEVRNIKFENIRNDALHPIEPEENSIERVRYLYSENEVIGYVMNENEIYIYEKNVLGDIIGIVNESNEQVARYSYNGYGECNIEYNQATIGSRNPFRYRGYYYDEETQLYWVSSRYYSPELCRWISPDSIEYLDPSSINGLNLYAYCGNDPINKYDPTGHFAISALIIGAIIGAAIGFGGTVLADYVDDGQIFNGSISAGGYIANTLVGGLIGALTGGIASSSFTFTYPTLQFAQMAGANGLTFGAVSVGTATATISGTSVVTALGLAGITVMGVRIGKSGGYRVDHHYPNDHDPTHVHISGDDGMTRVDINGNPIQGDRPMTPGERKAFWKLIEKIIEALKPWM